MQRRRVDLNDAWSFVQRGCTAEVTLPHCWNAEDTFREGVVYYRGRGTYQRSFAMPVQQDDHPGTWRLCSGGFYGRGRVVLNGVEVAKVDGAFLGFCIDVSDGLRFDASNDLMIELSSRHHRHMLPGIKDPDFVLYGGLSGRVWLEWRPLPGFDDASIRIDCDETTLTIHHALCMSGVDGAVRVRWRIKDVAGDTVAEQDVAPGERWTMGDLSKFERWDVERPMLYSLIGTVVVDGVPGDTMQRRFGVRTIAFKKGEGFLLNGRRVALRGCNRHESMPGYGAALPVAQHRKDAEMIKAMGLNAVRLAHYPQHPAFLDACDELGILVYAEIATWKSVTTGRWLDAAERQLRGMIQRDQHHPSIILWGLGNESRSRVAYERLDRVAHELDPGRFTIYAENHLYRARRKQTLNVVDVWGCNYELDVLDEAASCCRTGVALVSECSNSPHAVRGNAEKEQEQADRIAHDLNRIAQHPGVAGFFIWSFQDYATMRKKRYKRHCGLVDAWRRPKRAARMLTERFASASQR